MTANVELARQERVLGNEAGQEREAVEAGVRAGEQDEHRRDLEHVVRAVPRAVPEDLHPSWLITVGNPETYGVAWVKAASNDTPATSDPSTTLMTTSTRRAFGPSGGLNAPTPLEMASKRSATSPRWRTPGAG